MARPAGARLRLGVVGLGRGWEARHQPALAALRDRLEVVAVYDQVARRAEIIGRQVGARAAEGLVDLIENPEVEAVALLAPQWFGAQPIALAARAGKPIYTALPLPADPAGLAEMEALGLAHHPTLLSEAGADAPAFDQFVRLVRGLDHAGPTWGAALAAARASAQAHPGMTPDPVGPAA